MDQVKEGETIFITSHGKVVAQLKPVGDVLQMAIETLNKVVESANVYDVVSPIVDPWNAIDGSS